MATRGGAGAVVTPGERAFLAGRDRRWGNRGSEKGKRAARGHAEPSGARCGEGNLYFLHACCVASKLQDTSAPSVPSHREALRGEPGPAGPVSETGEWTL